MATSGNFDYTVTADNIITCALEDLQVVQSGETIATADYVMCLRTLNLMTKEWMGKPTFAPGMKRWTRNYIYMFMQGLTNIYVMAQGQVAESGSASNYAALNAYYSATLTSAAAAGQAVINVTTTKFWPMNADSGGYAIANTWVIGVVENASTVYPNGYIQWTTVLSGGGTAALTLNANLSYPASNGAVVFAYPITAVVDLPLEFVTCVRRDINGIDYPMDKMFDVWEYEQITNKTVTSTPTRWFWEKKRIDGNMYIDCYPATLTDVFRIVSLYPIADETTTANDMAFPQQWYGALEWGLAKKLAPKFGKSWTDTMEQNYNEAMISASAVDAETVPQYFQPNRDDYGSNFSGLK